MIILVAVLAVSVSFGQVDSKTLDMDSINSTWTNVEKVDWNKAVIDANGIYGKVEKFESIKSEHIVSVVEIINIKKSFEMVTDSTGTNPKYSTQWLVYHKTNGDVEPFLTYDDPFVNGDTSESIAKLMKTAGLHRGDDDETNTKHPNDNKFAPRDENNIDISDDF